MDVFKSVGRYLISLRNLRIHFQDGSVREYQNVPQEIYDKLISLSVMEQKAYFEAAIANKYVSAEIKTPDLTDQQVGNFIKNSKEASKISLSSESLYQNGPDLSR